MVDEGEDSGDDVGPDKESGGIEIAAPEVGGGSSSSHAPAEQPNVTIVRLSSKGSYVDGRFIRKRSGSDRPLDIWPEIWDAMGPVAREKYRVDFDRRLAEGLVKVINVSNEDIASLVSAPATVANPDIPSMPTCPATVSEHRQKINDAIQYFDACVVRSVHKKEWQSNKLSLIHI